jgi:hypothetical protein
VRCRIPRWSGTSPARLIVKGFQVPEELVAVGEPPDAPGGQVRLGVAELFLPGGAVDPGVLLGNDGRAPGTDFDLVTR